jgi:formamidopyrimidine-DNA glycosylase
VPELPEVEVLVRHLQPLLQDKTIVEVRVYRAKTVAPSSPRQFGSALRGARFAGVTRRGKYLLFELQNPRSKSLSLLGHLGMTGRMYLLPSGGTLPKHVTVRLGFGRWDFVFEDTRYFGRLTLDSSPIQNLGPEPLADDFTPARLADGLARSVQPVKVKLLDQSLLAGVGNIYASEALFRAGISPCLSSRRLSPRQIEQLWQSIREVLSEAIQCGSTVPLSFSVRESRDRLFYFGRAPGTPDFYEERLRVYDRAGEPCLDCGSVIQRLVQAARSTFFCPRCQDAKKSAPARRKSV